MYRGLASLLDSLMPPAHAYPVRYFSQYDNCPSVIPVHIILRLLGLITTSVRMFPFLVGNSILFSGCTHGRRKKRGGEADQGP